MNTIVDRRSVLLSKDEMFLVKSHPSIHVAGISLYARLSFSRGNNMPEAPCNRLVKSFFFFFLCWKQRPLSCLPIFNSDVRLCPFRLRSLVLAEFLLYLHERAQSWQAHLRLYVFEKKKELEQCRQEVSFTTSTTKQKHPREKCHNSR